METSKRTKVIDILQSEAYDTIVNVKGWVRTHRDSKAVHFIAINDGSTIKNVQVVADTDRFNADLFKQITTGLSQRERKTHQEPGSRTIQRNTGYRN